MIYDFTKLRPKPSYPTYPPYHTGLYLEDYFFEYYIRNKGKFDEKRKQLLPIFWTTLYVENTPIRIQDYIDVLPKDVEWFAVSQHDDGIKQRLPLNTVHFSAGGNSTGIPIPLICSPIPDQYTSLDGYDKSIFCSFIGSTTHPIRQSLYNTYGNNKDFYFSKPKGWTQTVGGDAFNEFIDTTKRSVFSLCPRGYGASSFRLYEVLQLGSIPVYVSNKHWLPFSDKIDWNEFCVIIKDTEINNLYDILKAIPEDKRKQMTEKGKEIWKNYFTLEKTCDMILESL